jgi:hypothetical protein
MPGKRPDLRLDSILDSVLARSANVSTPPGLEERILATLARKRARMRRRVQTAAFIIMVGMFFTSLFHPVNSAMGPVAGLNSKIEPTMKIIEPDELEDASLSFQQTDAAAVVRRSDFVTDQTPEPDVTPVVNGDDSFISDFEVESLTMATLQLSNLSEGP